MQSQKTLAFQVFCQGREYRIYLEGGVEGFQEIIEGPPAFRDAPHPIIVNHFSVLLAEERARIIQSCRLTSPASSINGLSANGSPVGGTDEGGGGSQGVAEKSL